MARQKSKSSVFKKKKILVSISYYLPNISGITIYAHFLAKKLAEKNSVKILTSGFQRNLPSKEKKDNISVRRVWTPIKINKGILMPFFPFISFKEALKADLIICHLPQLEAIWLSFWGKILKKPVILVHHCEFSGGPRLSDQIIKFLIYWPHYLAYLWADKIIGYTEDYGQSSIFLSRFLNKAKFILPPVVLGPKKEKEIKKIAQEIGKKEKTKIIGFVGRIGWEKGIDLILKTIPRLKKELGDLKIVFAGPYRQVLGDKTYQNLKNLFKKHKKEIVLIGPVAHKELVNYYHNFDCLVLPSTNSLESFGIVQPEAMLAGCPVIASNLPGVRVPVKLTKMGKVISPGSVPELVRAIIEVVKNKKELAKKQALAQKIFSSKKFFDQWQKALRSNFFNED